MVANSSVSTHLTVVLIAGHDESTIRHTSQSREEIRNRLRHLNSFRAHVNSSLHLPFCEIPGYPPGTNTTHLEFLCQNELSAFEGDIQ